MTMAVTAQPGKSGPSLIGAALLVVMAGSVYAFLWRSCLTRTGGHFVYAMDDPYIHLSIARNLAFHGVWGVTEFAHTSASSSPLWICLLAFAIRVFGSWLAWPLVFGILFSIAATLFAYFRFVRSGIAVPLATLGSMAIFAIAPFQLLPFTGMEHSLQIFLDLLFTFWLFDVLERETRPRDFWVGIGLSALICLCRYEDVFLVTVPFFAFVWRKEWRLAIALAIGPILAIGGFGLFSHELGMPLLPNSLVLKGTVPHTFSMPWFQALFLHFRAGSLELFDVVLLCASAAVAMRLTGLRTTAKSLQVLLWMVIIATIFHAGLATIGLFFRYEAYLAVLATTLVILSVRTFHEYVGRAQAKELSKRNWLLLTALVIAGQFLLAPLFWFYQLNANLIVSAYVVGLYSLIAMHSGATDWVRLRRVLITPLAVLGLYYSSRNRGVLAFEQVAEASSDVYLQQYQMARFVHRYYPTGRLAANDIGAVTYYSKVRLLDLWGLASNSVRDLKLAWNWNTKSIKGVLNDFEPDLIIAYPQWFCKDRAFPNDVLPVASWTIPAVTSAGRRTVMFYSPNPTAASVLRTHLIEFERMLPANITTRYGQEAVANLPPF